MGLATYSMAALAQQVWQHILETLHCKLARSEHDETLVCRRLQPPLIRKNLIGLKQISCSHNTYMMYNQMVLESSKNRHFFNGLAAGKRDDMPAELFTSRAA